jgi:hypothetical protein
MALITKSHLAYQYSWTAIKGDDPKISGPPDSTMFSRNEGYEVLYLINAIANEHGLKEISSAQKIEKMIKQYLPADIRSQAKVKQWIETNWKNY